MKSKGIAPSTGVLKDWLISELMRVRTKEIFLLSAGLFPQRLQWLGPGQAKARKFTWASHMGAEPKHMGQLQLPFPGH